VIIQIDGDYKEFTWSDELRKSVHGENIRGYRIGSGFSKIYRDRFPSWGTKMRVDREELLQIITPLG
jgi:hypothetical protein